MILIVGLGNPGEKYADTRHNIGWQVVDHLHDAWSFVSWDDKKKFKSHIAKGTIGNTAVTLVKPQTFMNNSGDAVGELGSEGAIQEEKSWGRKEEGERKEERREKGREKEELRAGGSNNPTATLAGHNKAINTVAFSPAGDLLATGSSDTTIRLWDLDKQRAVAALTGHTSKVHCVAFSPDGRTLASGGNDGTLRLWNLLLNKQVAVFQGHRSAIWKVAFSPDGQTLASTSLDATIRLWRAAPEHDTQDRNESLQ